jgi:hypothetical protein
MAKRGMSRRQFIGSAATGAVGAGLAGPILAQETGAADNGGAGRELVYRTLGRTGLKIP